MTKSRKWSQYYIVDLTNLANCCRIRPLQTHDLRYRRLSGRHQIAVDGRHLVDGVPFGRPFLRRFDRPRVKIPPRKRPRLIEEDEMDNFEGQRALPNTIQLRTSRNLQRGFSNAVVQVNEELEEEQDEEDQDFVLDDNAEEDEDATTDNEELAREVQDLEQDSRPPISSTSGSFGAQNGSSAKLRRTSRKRPVDDTNGQGLGIKLRDSLSTSNGLGSDRQNLWTGPYENPLLDEHYDGDVNHSRSKKAKRSHPQPSIRRALAPRETPSSPGGESRRESMSSQTRNVRFEDHDAAIPLTITAKQDEVESDDKDLEEASESTSSSSQSDKENVSPGEVTHSSSPAAERLSSSPRQRGGRIMKRLDKGSTSSQLNDNSSLHRSSSEPADASSSESTSSSGFSSSGSVPESTSDSNSGSDSDSDSDTDTDSDSDANSDSDSEYHNTASKYNSPTLHTHKIPAHPSKSNKVNGEPVQTSTQIMTKQKKTQQSIPGRGLKRTKLRNQRRRVSLRMKNLKERGEIPDSFNRNDYIKWEEEKQASQQKQEALARSKLEQEHLARKIQAVNSIDEDLAAALETRKAELLHSIAGEANGQVASNETLQTMVDDRGHVTSNETLQAMVEDYGQEVPAPLDSVAPRDEANVDEIKECPASILQESNQAAHIASVVPSILEGENVMPQSEATDIKSNKRRAKLDVASSRRMLFGSLGVRAPKTQEEADAIRQKLSANIRVAPQPRPDASLKLAEIEPEATEADTSWKDKITLKAVECCHEGIELSTPPFPFVQRWDPQQKGDFHGRRSLKKQKRRASQYYENSKPEESQERYVFKEGNYGQETQGEKVSYQNHSDFYPTLSEEYQSAANEQLLRDSGALTTKADSEVATDDLPELPTDIETYPTLIPATALQGSIIAFKQLEVSARTCWQPQISKYRVAAIENVPKAVEGGILYLKLATRDQGNKEADFDPVTGERIYGKFEMPMLDEDKTNSHLELSLDEMIEPRLIRPLPSVASRMEGQEQWPTESAPLVQVEETPQEDSIIGPKMTHAEEQIRSASLVKDSMSQERRDESEHVEKSLLSGGPDSASRKEVSILIKNAGFRSSIDPETAQELKDLGKNTEAAMGAHEAADDDDDGDSIQSPSPVRSPNSVQSSSPVQSPSFNGFESSPPRMDEEEEIMEYDQHRSSEEGDNEEQDYESIANKPLDPDSDQDYVPGVDSTQSNAEETEERSDSMGWYAANLRRSGNDSLQSREESSHDAIFDTTGNSNPEGASSEKNFDNADLSNLDGTTEISNLDGASYDMIGTQAAPKLGNSSPNPLPSPIQMSSNSNKSPSAQLSDQLPETIPPTSTSKVNGDSSPRQLPFRDSSKSPFSKVLDELDQGSSPVRQSKRDKALIVRGGYESTETSNNSASRSDSYKHTYSERTSSSDSELPSFEKMFNSQRSSARSPIPLSSDSVRPVSSSLPPIRTFKSGRTSLDATKKDSKLANKSSQAPGPTASQKKIKKESVSQSQTRIKEEQLSQRLNLFDDDGLEDWKNLDDDDSHDNFGTQPPKRSLGKPSEKTTAKASETITRPTEAIIVDLTQDSDLQSPGGSEYGGRKSARGSKGKRKGARETQSLGGEGMGSGNMNASRKRVIERTRSRV